LTLVKNLVEMHNGKVEARSAGLGKGSEFIVRLPLVAQRNTEEPVQESGQQPYEPFFLGSIAGNLGMYLEESPRAASISWNRKVAPTMQDMLTTAMEMHRTGQLGPAAHLYQQVLAREQENADALHLLGVLHHQQGEHARAVEKIGRAVALQPNVPAFHANLAEAYRALGQFDRAAGCCRVALRLWPDYPEALCNLGLALQGQGRHAEAAEHFRSTVQLRPDFATAHNNLGLALREVKQFDEALAHFRRAVELAPDSATFRTNLGQMLVDTGKPDEALPHCQEAVRLQPDVAVMYHNLGTRLAGPGQARGGPGSLPGGAATGPQPRAGSRPPRFGPSA
jgi:tetratricopeptide (TPR) repeat protein